MKRELLQLIREEANTPSQTSKSGAIDSHLLFKEASHIVHFLGYSAKGKTQRNIFSDLPGWVEQDTIDTHPTVSNCELLLQLIRYRNSLNLFSIIRGLESANYITRISTEGNVEKTTVTIVFENNQFNLE